MCFAEDSSDYYIEQFEINDIKKLKDNLPDDTVKILENLKFDLRKPNISAITPEKIFAIVLDSLKLKFSLPMRVIAPCIGAVILCAIISNVAEFKNLQISKISTIASTCACVVCIVLPITNSISSIVLAIKTASNFILCLAPVLVGISVCAGKPVTATVLGSSMVFASNSIFLWLQNFIEPVSKILLGIAISGSVCSGMNFKKLFDVFYRILKWILFSISSIFALAISLQKVISIPVDNASCKGLKLATGLTPIIGSCLGDAAETIRACATVLSSGVGAFGVISVFLIFLSPVLECCTWIFSISLCEFFSGIFEIENLVNLMSSCRKVITIVLVSTIFSFVIFLISAGILFFQ
jgi:hypothetical protein